MSLDSIISKLIVDDPSIPQWALSLMEAMKVVINELKVVKDLASRINELEGFKAISEAVNSHLQEENTRLNHLISKLEAKVDDQEQRSRNSCLLFHGLPENEGEDTNNIVLKTMNEKLMLDIDKLEIQRSHRMGPREDKRRLRSNRPHIRPVIVRFTNYETRRTVLKHRKLLKGTKVSISENLTSIRYTLLKKAAEKYGPKNVWSYEGRVTTKIQDRYVTINCLADLN